MQETVHESGLVFERLFGQQDPYGHVEWVTHEVTIGDPGNPSYHHEAFEAPSSWSPNSVRIVADKYAVKTGVPQSDGSRGGEWSVRQIVDRVADTIAHAGQLNGYFQDEASQAAFRDDLKFLLVDQAFAFNSPVWFNWGRSHAYGITSNGGNWALNPATGVIEEIEDNYAHPQGSACFIQPIQDTINGEGGISDLIRAESQLFKGGSGTGTNFSNIRGAGEPLSAGGKSSGLMSFLRVLDRNAGAIKSGGTTRRAAKMVILDADHPEIESFVSWKATEERKAHALIEAGYASDFEGDAYDTVSGQNSNNSVWLPNAFLEAVHNDTEWRLLNRTNGEPARTLKARDLWQRIGEAAWQCGDPAPMFSDHIQAMHTCPQDGPIRATNPCAEYIFHDNTSCNLASLNLGRFHPNGGLDVDAFQSAIRVAGTAMDIIIQHGGFPTKEIAEGSHRYRTIGLGYANVGALLLQQGTPYGSPEARATMAAITSLMTATAYQVSAEIAQHMGSFPAYRDNAEAMHSVLERHVHSHVFLTENGASHPGLEAAKAEHMTDLEDVITAGNTAWEAVLTATRTPTGFRNAQATVIAPTGTIGFMMGCTTTGIEPVFSLRTQKHLAGGDSMMLAVPEVDDALEVLGYDAATTTHIVEHIKQTGSIHDAPGIKPEHTPVFATAVDPHGNHLDWRAHLEMVASVQPFLSGGVSKTVNLPNSATPQDILDVYMEAHALGLKNTSVYRDGCKASQPLTVDGATTSERPGGITAAAAIQVLQEKAPEALWGYKTPSPARCAHSESLRYQLGGVDVSITLRFIRGRDGQLRLLEVFLNAGEQGDAIWNHAQDNGRNWSKLLRYGAQPKDIARGVFQSAQGNGAGFTDHPLIKKAQSLADFVWKVIMLEVYGDTTFVPQGLLDGYMADEHRDLFIWETIHGLQGGAEAPRTTLHDFTPDDSVMPVPTDLTCPNCLASGPDAITVTGTCKTCTQCGHSFGGC